MYNQTYTQPQDGLNELTEKDKTAQEVSFSSNQVTKIKSLQLDKLYNLVDESFSPSWISINMKFSTQTPKIYLHKKVNTPTCIWLSYANELVISPFLPNQDSEKRPSVEIVKRYSLSDKVQKIYLNQISYYINVDVVLNCENILDEQYEIFFEYEKQLLNILNLPINFNYYLKDSFNTHSDNVLIFEK
ncbi:MAG: hypothetical protein HY429_03570 [Candidatus Levybacteria bacterium]|nr:hypothetical protein [Candidatus Levybacteria bacterium]